MSPVLLLWISLISGVIAVVAAIAWFATGRTNGALRVTMGIAVIVCVVAGFVARR